VEFIDAGGVLGLAVGVGCSVGVDTSGIGGSVGGAMATASEVAVGNVDEFATAATTNGLEIVIGPACLDVPLPPQATSVIRMNTIPARNPTEIRDVSIAPPAPAWADNSL
jgi:hypothetical protein